MNPTPRLLFRSRSPLNPNKWLMFLEFSKVENFSSFCLSISFLILVSRDIFQSTSINPWWKDFMTGHAIFMSMKIEDLSAFITAWWYDNKDSLHNICGSLINTASSFAVRSFSTKISLLLIRRKFCINSRIYHIWCNLIQMIVCMNSVAHNVDCPSWILRVNCLLLMQCNCLTYLKTVCFIKSSAINRLIGKPTQVYIKFSWEYGFR